MESESVAEPSTREIVLEQEDMQMIQAYLRSGNPSHFLQIAQIRYQLAMLRAGRMAKGNAHVMEKFDSAVIAKTVEHNMEQLHRGAAIGRCDLLINVLRSIERVYEYNETNQILCVGPRTESEILGLIGAGFQMKNIRALDLISYSPLVDLGDMHAMPYPEKSFDVIILGWVIGYSKDCARVAKEVRRVAKRGAVVAIGCEYQPRTNEELKAKGGLLEGDHTAFSESQQYLELFEGNIEQVYFRHDPLPHKKGKAVGHVMAIFQLK